MLLHKSHINSKVNATDLWYQQKEELLFFSGSHSIYVVVSEVSYRRLHQGISAHEHQGKLAPGRKNSPSVKHCKASHGERKIHQANRAEMAVHEVSHSREQGHGFKQ